MNVLTGPATVILGASKGLGLALARACKERGDRTVEIASTMTDGQDANMLAIRCDMRNIDEVFSTAKRINGIAEIARFYWVAGRMHRGTLEKASISDLLEITDINYRNALPIVHTIWKKMISSPQIGKFVVVASSAGKNAKAGESIYVGTKHAQVGFTRSLGLENTNEKLTVCLVLPGGMRTGMWDSFVVPELHQFSDPELVARRLLDVSENATDKYVEFDIPRGLQ
jgi:short-subunit dehydrogenase